MNRISNAKLFFAIAAASLLSFLICLGAFNSAHERENTAKEATDKLSGETYFSGDIQNYKDANPYGSAFIGFDELSDRGVPGSDMTYIQDVLTNFTMYNRNVFNGKISYVANSFKRTTAEGAAATDAQYEFRFGINDGQIHTVKVSSQWLTNKIRIAIYEGNDRKFEREFMIFAE